MDPRKDVQEIFSASLDAVDPFHLVTENAGKISSVIDGGEVKGVSLVAFGKAAYPMYRSAEASLDPGLISEAIVITKYGHVLLRGSTDREQRFGAETVFEAGHPLPDDNGIRGTKRVIDALRKAGRDTLVVCLISGGGSALLVSPLNGITLPEKQAITSLLLKSGADVHEINTVRKHISEVKGGRLAEIAFPSPVLSFMISDVIGDTMDVIASGPTVPDSSTYENAVGVIKKYGLLDSIPGNVRTVLIRGQKGEIPDTPKQGSVVFQNVQNLVVGNNRKALDAAAVKASSMGYRTEILSSSVAGEAREVGRTLADMARERSASRRVSKGAPVCYISGGETTVTVTGSGTGGRNTELALSFAIEAENLKGVTLLSAGTDGTDGPTDAAGAIADGSSVEKARGMGCDPGKHLADNDSYHFFSRIDSLIRTGPTGTNVMDVQIMVVE